MVTSRAKPHAHIVGINHWYHHACPVGKAGAVQSGLQHMTVQPALLNIPSFPAALQLHWDYVEDDEFAYRVSQVYGEGAIFKLRYLIGKFDVGLKEGGLQTPGAAVAKAQQAAQNCEVVAALPHVFEPQITSKKGRTAGVRPRLRVPKPPVNVHIGGLAAGKVIEKHVRSARKKK